MRQKPTKRGVKANAVKRRASELKVKSLPKAQTPRRAGPRLDESQKAFLLALLAAGEPESAINQFFLNCNWKPLASSTLAHYRKLWASEIAAAAAARTEEALTTGMALRAERVAALKLHADQLSAMRWLPDRNGRLWNERAWRQTLADIAEELGERRPKKENGETETVKIYVGLDPERV